jgi:hypothetical protein
MNKTFYHFIAAFFIAFAGVFTLMVPQLHALRSPANTWDTTNGTTVLVQNNRPNSQIVMPLTNQPVYNMGQLNGLYTVALTNEQSYSQQAAANQLALNQALQNRNSYMAANSHSYMWPGNPYDQEITRLNYEKNRISANRQNNFYSSIMQMALMYSSMQVGLPAEAKQEFITKYNNLVTLYSNFSTQNMYTYPQSSAAFLASTTPTSALGTTTPTLAPGTVTPIPTSPSTDIPIGGIITPTPDSTTTPVDNIEALAPTPTTTDPVIPVTTDPTLVEPEYSQYLPTTQ